MAVTADLTRKDSYIYCGGVEAVLPVGRLALDGKRRYAHPSCVARALEENPADRDARVCALQFGMRRDLERAQAAPGAIVPGG
jgi:hypothetical protein